MDGTETSLKSSQTSHTCAALVGVDVAVLIVVRAVVRVEIDLDRSDHTVVRRLCVPSAHEA